MPAQCCAYTLKGHPCRGYGTPTHLSSCFLCPKHRDFYKGDRPDRLVERLASIYQTDAERKWMVTMLRCPLYRANPHRLSRIFKCIANKDRILHIFDLYVEANQIGTLTKNLLLVWDEAVRRRINMIRYSYLYRVAPHYKQTLIDILIPYFKNTDPTMSLLLLVEYLCFPAQGIPNIPEFQEMFQTVVSTVMKCLNMTVFATYSIRDFLASITRCHEHEPDSLWNIEAIRTSFEGLLKFYQREARANLRTITSLYKEELMMQAWRPARVEAALEAGFNVEDL